MDKGCTTGFTSHYVLVKHKRATYYICRQQFDDMEGLETYFPIEIEEEPDGDEIVLFDRFVFDFHNRSNLFNLLCFSAQVWPRFIVHYTLNKKSIDHSLF